MTQPITNIVTRCITGAFLLLYIPIGVGITIYEWLKDKTWQLLGGPESWLK